MNDRPEVKFKKVLEAAQKNRASHQKCLHILDGIYKKMGFNDFKQIFLRYLKAIFSTESFAVKNDNVERLLEFLAHFVVQTIPTEDNETIPDDPFEDVPTHPFFTDIVMETLKFHCLTNLSLRFNSCLYLRLLLQNISSNVNVDYDICERIMEAMLERTTDIKPSIRLQAVMALVKLQDPSDPDCPVIKAYLGLLLDGNPLVRREVVKRIAAYIGSAPYIMRHLRDVDANVRLQAFKRCADMGPKLFKIYERQDILMCGLNETHEKVRKSFQEDLLIKWLNAYEGDFIKLLNSIKIDAEETDMLKTQHISKSIMDIYFKIRPIRDIISSLPLNEEKLIPQEKMVAEVILLWKFVVRHLRKCSGELNMDVEEILPELTAFCEYIQSTINTAKGKNMEDWEYLEYQHILYSLFQIAEGYDFSDEVGRKTLNQMVLTILTDEKNHLRTKRKLLKIASEIYPKSEDITTAVCCLISDIREPLIEVEEEIPPPATTKYDNHDFRVATLKVKLNTLEEAMEEAADRRDFLKAEQLKEEAQKMQEEIALLIESRAQQVKTVKDDPKTVSHCLDLLIALLELPSVRKISTALETVKNEFLLPLLDSSIADINWRVLQCLALFASMSIELAEEYLKVLCIPLMTCRVIPNYNKCALKVSIKAVADLYHLYGAQIFGGFNEISNAAQNSNTSHTRRLYDDGFEESIVDPNKFQFENVIDILMDLVDEEDVEIHEYATKALHRLILNNFPVSPTFIIRIILKWYNPATAKSPNQVQQVLGVLIVMYASKVKGAKETIAKAVLPILRNVACVPKADPLSEIDTDNLLNYLAVITSSDDEKEATDLHIKLTRLILNEVGKCRNLVLLGYLTKLLTNLNIPVGDTEVVNNIIEHAERLVSDESLPLDKTSIKCIEKFVQKIKYSVEQKDRDKECENDETTDSESVVTNNENNNQEDGTVVSSTQRIAENNAPTVEADSLIKNTEKGQDIHRNMANNENSDDFTTPSKKSKQADKNSDDIRTTPKKSKQADKNSDDIRTPPKKSRQADENSDDIRTPPKKSKQADEDSDDIRTPPKKSKQADKNSDDIRTPPKRSKQADKNSDDIRTPPKRSKQADKNSDDIRTPSKKSRQADENSDDIRTPPKKSKQADEDSDDIRTPPKKSKQADKNSDDIRTPPKRSKQADKNSDDIRTPSKKSEQADENSDDIRTPSKKSKQADEDSDDIRTPPEKKRKNGVGKITQSTKAKECNENSDGVPTLWKKKRKNVVGQISQISNVKDVNDDIRPPSKKRRKRDVGNILCQPNNVKEGCRTRAISKENVSSGSEKADSRNVSMDSGVLQQISRRSKFASPEKQITRGTRLDAANKNSNSPDHKDTSHGKNGEALHQNPKKGMSEARKKEKTRVLSKDNVSSDSEKADSRNVSMDGEELQQKSRRSTFARIGEQITRGTRLDAARLNANLSEHKDTSHGKKGGALHQNPKKEMSEARKKEKTRVLSKENVSSDSEKADSRNFSMDGEELQQKSRRSTFARLREQITRGKRLDAARLNANLSEQKDTSHEKKGGALHHNPKKEMSKARMKEKSRVLSKENVSSGSEKADSRNVSMDSGVLQQRSRRSKFARLGKQITRGTKLDEAKKNSKLLEHKDTSRGKNGTFKSIYYTHINRGPLQQNPMKEIPEGKTKKRTRILSKENVSSDSEKAGKRNVSMDSEVLQQRSKRPKLVRVEKKITRGTRLDSAKKNSILSEHNDMSYTKNGTFRPIAESTTTCIVPVTSEQNTRTLTRSLSRLSEQLGSEMNSRNSSDKSFMTMAKNASVKLMNCSVSSLDSETSYKTRSSRSTRSSVRSSPIISRARRKTHIPNVIKKLTSRKIQMD
nr:unnamed protein product [Callosobruchus chinensis]